MLRDDDAHGATTTEPASPSEVPRLRLIEGTSARPEVDAQGRMRKIRARIAAGYYDREEVRSRLADAVLRLMRRP